MAKDIEFKKVKKVKNDKLEMAYTTTIRPKPPFYLFIPSYNEIPENIRKQNKGKYFSLGKFFNTKQQALKYAKESGYNKKDIEILQVQSYLKLKLGKSKKKLKEVV